MYDVQTMHRNQCQYRAFVLHIVQVYGQGNDRWGPDSRMPADHKLMGMPRLHYGIRQGTFFQGIQTDVGNVDKNAVWMAP